ncbi:MBL fold metallo-hydrolase [Natribacillus halophilus]|uniref:Metallo-beta-lactamase domain-containing protein n=1 Tax=Natribacillus halophilus TaxID=549003 RepID=A0A1G8KHQ6_9BACI|nr:hypothetical protein SAMN04488123_102107 [Natribacillus halophilus]
MIETSYHRFYLIEAPGHTADHVCLFEPYQGWLFSGDLYITPYPKVFLQEESMSARPNDQEETFPGKSET